MCVQCVNAFSNSWSINCARARVCVCECEKVNIGILAYYTSCRAPYKIRIYQNILQHIGFAKWSQSCCVEFKPTVHVKSHLRTCTRYMVWSLYVRVNCRHYESNNSKLMVAHSISIWNVRNSLFLSSYRLRIALCVCVHNVNDVNLTC